MHQVLQCFARVCDDDIFPSKITETTAFTCPRPSCHSVLRNLQNTERTLAHLTTTGPVFETVRGFW